MPLDMLITIVIVVAVVAVGLRAHLLGRKSINRHLTKEHFVSVVEVIMRLCRHYCEASVELNDALDGF